IQASASSSQPKKERREPAARVLVAPGAPPGRSEAAVRASGRRSGMMAFFPVAEQIVRATAAEGGVVGVRPDIGPMVPATLALLLFCGLNLDAQAVIAGGVHGGP